MKTFVGVLLFCAFGFLYSGRSEGVVVLNEILADPPSGIFGDANRDGVRDASDDEFVELVNLGFEPISISGWTFSDSLTPRHTFSSSASVPARGFFVLFGGGEPFGFEMFETSSTGTLALNNTGDSLFLYNSDGVLVDFFVYGSEGNQNTSLTRFPDAKGPFTRHNSISDSLFSPSTTVEGQERLPQSEAIPEPSSLFLLGSGLLGYTLSRRLNRKHLPFLGCVMVILSFSGVGWCEEMIWEDVTRGIPENDFRTIALDPFERNHVYVGTSKSLYKTVNGGRHWKRILSLRGTLKAVNQIYAASPGNVWVVTENGLYYSSDYGEKWEKQFSGMGGGRKVLSIAMGRSGEKERIWIGTGEGFFYSDDTGRHWERVSSELSNETVSYLYLDTQEETLYAVTPRGVYRSSDFGKSWERIFVTSVTEEISNDTNGTDAEDVDETTASPEKVSSILTQNNPPKILLGTQNGIYQSEDAGKNWSRLSEVGLKNSEINHLFLHKNLLYAATQEGIFVYRETEKKWKEIPTGLTEGKIVYLSAFSGEETLWAVSQRGVLRMKRKRPERGEWERETLEMLSSFEGEPSIGEIQEVAIRYSETHPEKINAWRKAVSRKGWFPKVTTGIDIDIDRNVDIDRGGTGDTDFFIIGPDERAFNWDIDVTWDLGELIWNDDQTSIDVRSRLMVQLRDDILDEVTRLYFERRRLQIALLTQPPKTPEEHISQELRLQELTADIDALTGGYLSQVLRVRRK